MNKIHGGCGTSLYGIWKGMRERCGSPSSKDFANYGGRGIKVCERWQSSFAAFRADMGDRPSASHSIDRIENDGDYEPGNCRWATRAEQDLNKRGALRLTMNGETLPVLEWAERTGIPYESIKTRIRRGWPAEKALAPAPVRKLGLRLTR